MRPLLRILLFAAWLCLLLALLLACRMASLSFGLAPEPRQVLAQPFPTVPSPTLTPAPAPITTPKPVLLPLAEQLDRLRLSLAASLPATATPDPQGFAAFPGISGIDLLPIGGDQWAAYSTGMRSYDPGMDHFVAIYAFNGKSLEEQARLALGNPDTLAEGSVHVVPFPDSGLPAVWIGVTGQAGAHSGCFDLLRWMGGRLEDVFSHCTRSPNPARLNDLNHDSLPEVVLDTSDDAIFCYGCGVRRAEYQVWRYEGSLMIETELEKLPASAPDALRQANNQAVALAQADFWPEALSSIQEAQAIDPADPVAAWNLALIQLTHDSRLKDRDESALPLLANLYYGDWDAALDSFRPYRPSQIFSDKFPGLDGTPAEGQPERLAEEILAQVGRALQTKPDLAAVYYLRAWATYMQNPKNWHVRADMQKASELDPGEKLYASAVRYLFSR